MKTTRKIKILLTTREVLVTGGDQEVTGTETGAAICPVCHSPLPAPDAIAAVTAAIADNETEAAAMLEISEIKRLKDGDKQ